MVLPVIVLGYVLVSSYPPGVLFGLFLAYALSGYVMAALTWRNGKKRNSDDG
jgi:CDP-diacylglycerol--serine O-phosphatidyltransferase